MNPLTIFGMPQAIVLKLVGIALVVAAAVFGAAEFIHYERDIGRAEVRAAYEQALAKQKREAAAVLAAETAKVGALELKLNTAKADQEKKDADNSQVVTDLSRKLAATRLRDPGAGRGASGGGTQGQATAAAAGGATNGTEASGVLSDAASEFLRRITREADEVNDAYISCRQDTTNVREESP